MREILFRGKTFDNEWVYGYYVNQHNFPCIYCLGTSVNECRAIFPESVGQYTGLTDKDGKMIFEGDVAQINMLYTHYCGEIFYKRGAWWIKIYVDNKEAFEVTLAEFYEDSNFHERISVIGNIFDNPELLKGDAEG